jgi:hypothetical protein
VKTFSEVGTLSPITPPAISSPPPLLEWGALLSVITAGAAYVGRVLLEQWKLREQSESALMKGLIDHLLTVQSQLIADSKETRDELIRHIDLKESVSKMATLIEEKVNRSLSGQTELYIESLKNQNIIISKVDAFHRRQDSTNKLLEVLTEGGKVEDTQ